MLENMKLQPQFPKSNKLQLATDHPHCIIIPSQSIDFSNFIQETEHLIHFRLITSFYYYIR